jgi:hypothetical protein
MRRLFFTLILGLLLVTVAIAQDDNTINYGDLVTGEITNQDFELEYSFEGSEGDVAVITMLPVDPSGDLTYPEILLLNEEFEVLVDTTRNISYRTARLITQLPSDGTYTIIASRTDGRAGDSVGEFTLSLIRPQELAYNEPVEASISSDGGISYYLVDASEPSLLSYELLAGDYDPQLSINTINEANTNIEEYITVNGTGLTTSILGILEEGMVYVILISKPDFAYYSDEVTADFTLTLLPTNSE